jgi:Helicase C-terminal domain
MEGASFPLAVHPEDGRQSPSPGPASGSALCSPYSLHLPQAALAFRQGFGRLIRRRDGRGIAAILDSRLLARTCGRVFVESLPRELPRTSILEQVRRWWHGQPLSAGTPTSAEAQ